MNESFEGKVVLGNGYNHSSGITLAYRCWHLFWLTTGHLIHSIRYQLDTKVSRERKGEGKRKKEKREREGQLRINKRWRWIIVLIWFCIQKILKERCGKEGESIFFLSQWFSLLKEKEFWWRRERENSMNVNFVRWEYFFKRGVIEETRQKERKKSEEKKWEESKWIGNEDWSKGQIWSEERKRVKEKERKKNSERRLILITLSCDWRLIWFALNSMNKLFKSILLLSFFHRVIGKKEERKKEWEKRKKKRGEQYLDKAKYDNSEYLR